MKTALITGANGFIGKNLYAALKRMDNIQVLSYTRNSNQNSLTDCLTKADTIYHLAGVNRPDAVNEFEHVNAGLTQNIVNILSEIKKQPTIVFSSSVQAALDNPYGSSKKNAEDILLQFAEEHSAPVFIYRLPNVFGKWCRPNYNSVVATFCYNISHDLEITVSDEDKGLELVYVDDVVNDFIRFAEEPPYQPKDPFCDIDISYRTTLGELVERIYGFKKIRESLMIPDLSDAFNRCLHATYISYLDEDQFAYPIEMKTDNRGWLAELIKSKSFGQIFISKTHEGIIRGNHYHNSKIEKFCLVHGDGVVKFRHILNGKIISYPVSGDNIEVVDIPPGYTHSIENIGDEEMIVIFWANQVFNPHQPDTYFDEVEHE